MAEYPIQNVSTGRTKLMIPIVNRKTLVDIKPDFNKVYNICKKLDTNGFHLFSFDTLDLESITVARHFAPTAGVNEDPVTGIAAGALGCYLVKYCTDRIECTENMKFIMEQGDHMNKKGRIYVHIRMTDSTTSLTKKVFGRENISVADAGEESSLTIGTAALNVISAQSLITF